MDTTELKEKVNKTEEDILHLLNKLMYDTGTKVTGLDITSLSTMSKTGFEATSLTDLKIIFIF